MTKNYKDTAVSFLAEIMECIDSDGEYLERFTKMLMEYNDYSRREAVKVIQEYRDAVELSSVSKESDNLAKNEVN